MYGKVAKGTIETGTKKASKQVSTHKKPQVLTYFSENIGWIVKLYNENNELIVDAAGFRTESAARSFAESYI